MFPRALLAAPMLALCAGCAGTPHADASFGDSVRAAIAAQLVDPAAAHNASPVNGVDGRAAAAANERYERSYKQPSEQAAPSSMVNAR
jgi:hypothetical protein